jgi:hypothetical protein
MADGYVIAYSGAEFLKSAMDAGAVLYINLVSDFNKVYIASYYGIEPETAVVTGNYIPNYSGIGGNKAISAELGVFIFYRQNYRHG